MTNSRLSSRKMEGTKVMKSKGIDGAALRIIAMLTLLIDHIGWFFSKISYQIDTTDDHC